MTLVVHSPDDIEFNEWSLGRVNADNGYVVLNVGENSGQAITPVMGYLPTEDGHSDWTEIINLDWSARNENGLTVTYRVGDTEAALAAASYSALTHNLEIPSANRKYYAQIKFVFNRNEDLTSPEITLVTVVAHQLDGTGLNHSLEGSRGTKDGKFSGRKYTCSICGLSGRKPEMIRQGGRLVHRDTCWDEDYNLKRRIKK